MSRGKRIKLADWLDSACLTPLPETAARTALIVAPHSDDETLGCGGTIARLAMSQWKVHVVIATDGSRSHPHSQEYPPAKLAAVRERETISALQLLGLPAFSVDFLGWPDGQMEMADSSKRQLYTDQAESCLRHSRPDLLLLPWRNDPHPDHRAVWELFWQARAVSLPETRTWEYPIWDWDPSQARGLPRNQSFKAWRIEIAGLVEQKRAAMQEYRSQLGELITDDPDGFRLTRSMLDACCRDREYFIEEVGFTPKAQARPQLADGCPNGN